MDIDILLNTDDKNFVTDLMDALGLDAGGVVTIKHPTFNRVDGRIITYFPRTVFEYNAIKNLSDENLRSIGCQVFDQDVAGVLWLYPKEWYAYIPDGLEIQTISNKTEVFVNGKTDNDHRYDALAFGFVKQHDR